MPYQLSEIRRFAKIKGIEIIKEFQEIGSASKEVEKRPEFQRMIQIAKDDPEINAIIVHDYSRFSRTGVKGLALKEELQEHGIRLYSVVDPELDPENDATPVMESVIFCNNQLFSRQISKQTHKGCVKNARDRDPDTGWCYWNGGQPIWGYKIQHVDLGKDSSGKPIIKSIIIPDNTIVQGKPIY